MADHRAALDRAAKALARGDEVGGLEQLIEGWRALPTEPLAAVIEQLSHRHQPFVVRPTGKLDHFHRTWLAMCRRGRASDLPVLVATVTEHTQRSGVAIVEAFSERATALADWPADPRATAVIKHLQTSACFGAIAKGHQPAWRAVMGSLVRHGDYRAIAMLENIDLARVFAGWNDVAGRIAFVHREAAASAAGLRTRYPDGVPQPTREVAAAITKLARQVARLPVVSDSLARWLGEHAQVGVGRAAPRPAAAAATDRDRDGTSLTAALADAKRALAASDDDAALAALLTAWRAWPAGELTALIDQLSVALDGELPDLAIDAPRATLQTNWLAVARDQRPRDLPRLLRAVTATHFRSTDAVKRLQALAGWPRDPRVSTGVAAHFEHVVFTANSTKPFWSELLALARAHLDRDGADALERIAARLPTLFRSRYSDLSAMRRWLARELAATIAVGRARDHQPLPANATRICGELAVAIASRGEPLARLLDEIGAAPHDDGPRQVYADRLQERGSPHGELIALQLADRDRRRQFELISNHVASWLGALAPLCWLDGCRFERGFVDTVWLSDRGCGAPLTRVIDDPTWRTVRRLWLAPVGGLPNELLDRLQLDHLGIATDDQFAELRKRASVRYRSLGIHARTGTLDSRRFAALREVELAANHACDPAHWQPLLAPVLAQLTAVSVSGVYDVALWVAWCNQHDIATLRVTHEVGDGGWLAFEQPDRRSSPIARAELAVAQDSRATHCDRLTVGRLAALLKTVPQVRELRVTGRPLTDRERKKLAVGGRLLIEAT